MNAVSIRIKKNTVFAAINKAYTIVFKFKDVQISHLQLSFIAGKDILFRSCL